MQEKTDRGLRRRKPFLGVCRCCLDSAVASHRTSLSAELQYRVLETQVGKLILCSGLLHPITSCELMFNTWPLRSS